jgi:LPS-assembly lipoprotein
VKPLTVHTNLPPPTSAGTAVKATARGLQRRRFAQTLLLTSLLGGCGFKLRGNQSFAFTSISINPSPGGAVAQELRRSFGTAVQVMAGDQPTSPAQVRLDVLDELREKVVVGINASGQVRELQLRIRVKFQLNTAQGKELIAPADILQQRDISYSESAALAKEAEESLLYRDMQTDIVQQILRRLAAVKPF